MRDILGAWLSFLCMLHCFLPMLLVAMGASLGLEHLAHELHGDWLHLALLLPIIIILAVSLPKGYQINGNKQPGIMALIGIVILTVAIIIGGEMETLLTMLGSVFVIYAHLLNRKSIKVAKLSLAKA